jgi:hypothetical protein
MLRSRFTGRLLALALATSMVVPHAAVAAVRALELNALNGGNA